MPVQEQNLHPCPSQQCHVVFYEQASHQHLDIGTTQTEDINGKITTGIHGNNSYNVMYVQSIIVKAINNILTKKSHKENNMQISKTILINQNDKLIAGMINAT